jgi:CheY-specific phosphatase CheX
MENDLAEIVEGAATLMLGLELGARSTDTEWKQCAIGASVQFTGDWSGALVIRCDSHLAHEAAAAMFGCDVDNIDPDELSDALGELANMIAGNVKPLLPAAALLSLPTVVQGSDLRLGVLGASPSVSLSWARHESVLSVAIYERSEKVAA